MPSVKNFLNLAWESATHIILRDFSNYQHYQENLAKQYYFVNPEEIVKPPSFWKEFCNTKACDGRKDHDDKCEKDVNDIPVSEDVKAQALGISDNQELIQLENNVQGEVDLEDNLQMLSKTENEYEEICKIKKDYVEEDIQILGILAVNNTNLTESIEKRTLSIPKLQSDSENKYEIGDLARFSCEETSCKKPNENGKKESSINDFHFGINNEHMLGKETGFFLDNWARGETMPESCLNTPPRHTCIESGNTKLVENNLCITLEKTFSDDETKSISSCHFQDEIVPESLPMDILLREPIIQNDANNLVENIKETKTTSGGSGNESDIESVLKSLQEMEGLLESFSDIDSLCANDECVQDLLADIVSECNCTTAVSCLQVGEYVNEDLGLLMEGQLESVDTGSVSDWLYRVSPSFCLQTVEDKASQTSEEELRADQVDNETEATQEQQDEHILKTLYITQWLDSMDLHLGSGDMPASN